ncbi:hypothetical protein [Halorussus pelagicus]|uniref:hypothetical protein n=1 Tax=Halorussus pelagicus TaxID=2505977 RepID=UPI000FFB6B43|nr:hypothetical protein [Halorussus pelagicus]
MVGIGALIIYALLLIPAIYYGNLLVKSCRIYYKLYLANHYDRGEIIDGEPAAIEGTVSVDESAYAADSVVENTGSKVGSYLWRSTFPTMLNSIDLKNREVKEHTVTDESGMEFGGFIVAKDGKKVRVDLSWLLDVHDGTRLSELTISSTRTPRKFRPHLWKSPFVHISEAKTTRTVEEVNDIINGYDDIPPSEHHIESKPIRDGTTLAVCGNIRIEDGSPVIYGSDSLPLAISDQGFEGLRRKILFRIGKYSFVTFLWLGVVATIWVYS